jgi:hypothetical protein
MQFTLPRSLLHENKLRRRLALDEYFPSGLVPFERAAGSEWIITPFVPFDVTYYVDPLIERSLQSWPESVNIESLGSYRRVYKNCLISFYDSWSLYYWALALSWSDSCGHPATKVALLHIDDHNDLDAPLLAVAETGYRCILSGMPVSITDPSSIAKAILNRSVGISSFIAPLLHHLESIEFLHLRYAHPSPPHTSGLSCVSIEDDLLAVGEQRPGVELGERPTRHRHMIAPTPMPLLEGISADTTLFFHLDCDALCNRYNLDSNWASGKSSIDLNLDQMKEALDQLLYQVSQLGCRVYMNIALSPGFFPSEYWQEVIQYVLHKGEEHQIIREDDFSTYLCAAGEIRFPNIQP